jgi:copper resistance protein D
MLDPLAIVRCVQVASLTILVGACVFDLLVARPACSQVAGMCAARRTCARLGLRLVAISFPVVVSTALAWLAVQGAAMSGRPLAEAVTAPILWAVLARTEFGYVWTLRMGLLVALGLALVWRGRIRGEHAALLPFVLGAVLGGAALVGLTWMGHAAATEGPARVPHIVSNSVHLLATGVWAGGLLPLALLLSAARRSGTDGWKAVACVAVQRFSSLAAVCVVSLLLTGIWNSWRLVGGVPALLGTSYGRLLLCKLGLVGLTLALGAYNRCTLVPRLLPSGQSAPLLARLRRTVLMEAALGLCIFFLASTLGVTSPASHHTADAPARQSTATGE